MTDFHGDFGPFDGSVWLNCAHQGPLPKPAVEAAKEATALKVAPHRLTDDAFWEVPARLKRAIGTLINAPPDQIVLGNSFSHGIHQLIRGLPWSTGDEVLLVDGDFPATTLPWRLLEKQGVHLRFIEHDAGSDLSTQLSEAITPNTRIFCATWVDSFTGRRLDIDRIGTICHDQDVWFVLNGSQGVGARPIDVTNTPIDALASCGYKWLCGPYGTGFTWVSPEIIESLAPVQAYWLPMQADRPLEEMQNLRLRTDLGTAGFDVFGTANFNNFIPWTASIEYLTECGLESIADHGERLVNRLIKGTESTPFEVLTPRDPARHANIVVLNHSTPTIAQKAHTLLAENGFQAAIREGNLRISPHLYNTIEEIDELVALLSGLSINE